MQIRRAWRGSFVALALAVGLIVSAMAGSAGAQSTQSLSGSVAYSAYNSGTFGGCYNATGLSFVDSRLDPSGAAVSGALRIVFNSPGSGLCGASSFQLYGWAGTLSGAVSAVDIDCNQSVPSPTNVCRLYLGLTVTNGTGRFAGSTGALDVVVHFTVIYGDFFTGRFVTGGRGSITGTLTQ